MNFTQVVAEVLSIVKRPDKLPDIRREINAAVNHFATDANWDRCLVEAQPAIVANEYTQALPLSTFPRFRKFWYIKRAGTKNYLKKLDTHQLGRTDCDMRDKYYIVGSNVNISMIAYASALDVGYFEMPPYLTDDAGEYWMLDLSPFMVIDRAAAKIFTNIGDDESARRHEGFAIAAYQSARSDYGMAIGNPE